ncbi:MAG: hypothetical protein NC827_04685 [Candidatus Omnitrophica bacterium]|nr:hypothetical protein [Candidatus Omnitrophota bacterium]MCM8802589.1 hypothetical protein [Candidatus Omnitrophota bacterium]
MKLKIFICCLFFAPLFLYSFWDVEEGEPTGFRNYTWGMEISSLYLREYSRTFPKLNGKVVYYTKKNEDLNLGGAKVESIEYGFWKEEVLCEVLIKFKGKENFERIKRALIEKYGKNYTSIPGTNRVTWKGKTTYLYIDFNESNQRGYLFMSPYPMRKFINIYESIVAKRGVKDF